MPQPRLHARGHPFPLMLLIVAGVGLFSVLLWLWNPAVVQESHALETKQSALLLLAAAAHLWRGRRNDDPLIARLHDGLSLICLGLFLRETDLDSAWDRRIMKPVERGFRLAVLALFCIYLFRMRVHYQAIFRSAADLLRRPAIVCTLTGALCYILSIAFDREWLRLELSLSQLVEETLELTATALILAGACVRLRSPLPPGEG